MAIITPPEQRRNPLHGMGSDIPEMVRVNPSQQSRGVKSAIDQAVDMFNKVINLKINRAPLPRRQVKEFAVAALPQGRILMGSGKTKPSVASKRMAKARAEDLESLKTIASKREVPQTAANLLLRIAIPASQVGTNGDRAFAFANYLNRILQPGMAIAPGLGAPALLPAARIAGGFAAPALAMKPEDSFKPVAGGSFRENTDKIQKEMARRFLAQFARGERPAAYGAIGGIGRTPIISRNTQSYALPAQQAAQAATIRAQIPTYSKSTIIY